MLGEWSGIRHAIVDKEHEGVKRYGGWGREQANGSYDNKVSIS